MGMAPEIFLPMGFLLLSAFLGYLLGRWTGLARGQAVGQQRLIIGLKEKALTGRCPVCGTGWGDRGGSRGVTGRIIPRPGTGTPPGPNGGTPPVV